MGDRVKGDILKWNAVAKETVLKALTAKFSKNPEILKKLKLTGDKILAEASRDHQWGTGYQLGNPNNMDPNTWRGSNWLGDLLMKTRNNLK